MGPFLSLSVSAFPDTRQLTHVGPSPWALFCLGLPTCAPSCPGVCTATGERNPCGLLKAFIATKNDALKTRRSSIALVVQGQAKWEGDGIPSSSELLRFRDEQCPSSTSRTQLFTNAASTSGLVPAVGRRARASEMQNTSGSRGGGVV